MINFFRNLLKSNKGYRVIVHRYSGGKQFEVFSWTWMSATEARAAGQGIVFFINQTRQEIWTFNVEKIA